MKFRKSLISGVMFLLIISCNLVAGGIVGKIIDEFDSDNVFLKIGVIEGGQSVKSIKVSNNQHGNHLSVDIKGLEGIVSFDEKEFDLGVGETKDVKVYFNTGDNEPGIYIGRLEIVSRKDFQEIPVVLEIQSKDVLFDSNIRLFPYGEDIILGDKLDVEIKIFDLVNKGVSDIAADYFIKDFDGRTIISESENLIVDSKLDYSKSFKLPEEIKYGSYVLGLVLKHGNSVGTSSIYFEISEPVPEESGSIWDSPYIFIIFLLGIFLVIIMFFGFYFMNRDSLVNEIRRSYKRELSLERKLYKEKLKQEYGLKGRVKKVYKQEVKKVGRQRKKAIKKSYDIKLRELRKLKKKGRKINYKTLLKKWKARGYDTEVIERKYKYPNVKDIKKRVGEWKKKGYDTRLLEKSN